MLPSLCFIDFGFFVLYFLQLCAKTKGINGSEHFLGLITDYDIGTTTRTYQDIRGRQERQAVTKN